MIITSLMFLFQCRCVKGTQLRIDKVEIVAGKDLPNGEYVTRKTKPGIYMKPILKDDEAKPLSKSTRDQTKPPTKTESIPHEQGYDSI